MTTKIAFYPFQLTEHCLLRCHERGIAPDVLRTLLRRVRIQNGLYSVCFLPTVLHELQARRFHVPPTRLNQGLVIRLNHTVVVTAYWYEHRHEGYRFGCPNMYLIFSFHLPKNNTMTQQQPPKPNDQRSNVKNPNNPAHKQDRDNRSNQGNPNHAPTQPKPRKG